MIITPPRSWATVIAAFVFIWTVQMLSVCIKSLKYFPPSSSLLFFSLPLLGGLGAYLLFTGNKFRFVPFLILPIMQIWVVIVLYPDQFNPHDWELGVDYFLHFPLGTRIAAALFAACAVYCLVLDRHRIFMASNNRSSGRDE